MALIVSGLVWRCSPEEVEAVDNPVVDEGREHLPLYDPQVKSPSDVPDTWGEVIIDLHVSSILVFSYSNRRLTVVCRAGVKSSHILKLEDSKKVVSVFRLRGIYLGYN